MRARRPRSVFLRALRAFAWGQNVAVRYAHHDLCAAFWFL